MMETAASDPERGPWRHAAPTCTVLHFLGGGAGSALGPAAPDPPRGHRRLNPSRPAPRFPSKSVQKVVRKISASAFYSRLRREKETDGGYWPPAAPAPAGAPLAGRR